MELKTDFRTISNMKHFIKWEFQQFLKPTDTEAIIQKALEICRQHPYRSIKPQGSENPTFTAFYSEADVKERKLRLRKDVVEVGELFNEYHIYRFEQAIDLARGLFKHNPTNKPNFL